MDYGLFRRFDKIEGSGALPRTSIQNGLFLIELRFSPEDETRSVSTALLVERTAFGEVARLSVPLDAVQTLDRHDLSDVLNKISPAVHLSHDATHLTFHLVDQSQGQSRTVPGALIVNGKNQLCVLAARLHS